MPVLAFVIKVDAILQRSWHCLIRIAVVVRLSAMISRPTCMRLPGLQAKVGKAVAREKDMIHVQIL